VAPASPTVGDCTEAELIARIRRRLAAPPPWLLVGIGDDAAVVEPERNRAEVLSVDCLVDGVHFDRTFVPAEAIGHRAMAVNLSDLAAMGAAPRLALLSLALPASLPIADFDAIIGGAADLASQYRLHVVGGNLTRTPGPLTIDVTVAGSVKPRQVLRRSGARAGDELYVSGSIGAAAAGLQILEQRRRLSTTQDMEDTEEESSSVVKRYLRPEPRVRLGALLSRNRVASACIDLSDGLADGVRQIAEAGGVGASIDAGAVPIEDRARAWFAARGQDPIDAALTGGDDYELLFAVRPRLRRRLAAVVRQAGVPVTRIGVCTEGRELAVTRVADGVRTDSPLPAGYGHFLVPSDVERR
jgi:thiamine-monophosphate kinase